LPLFAYLGVPTTAVFPHSTITHLTVLPFLFLLTPPPAVAALQPCSTTTITTAFMPLRLPIPHYRTVIRLPDRHLVAIPPTMPCSYTPHHIPFPHAYHWTLPDPIPDLTCTFHYHYIPVFYHCLFHTVTVDHILPPRYCFVVTHLVPIYTFHHYDSRVQFYIYIRDYDLRF